MPMSTKYHPAEGDKEAPFLYEDDGSLQEAGYKTAAQHEEESNNRMMQIAVVLLLLNTVGIAGGGYFGMRAYSHINLRVGPLQAIGEAAAIPSSSVAPEVLNLQRLMSNVSNTFFFGNPEGQIPNFLENFVTGNWSTLAENVRSFSSMVTTNLYNDPNANCSTGQVIHCPSNTIETRFCDNGNSVFCDDGYPSMFYCNSGCELGEVFRIASIVESVANVTKRVAFLTPQDNQPAAFSDGVFRMDLIIDWLSSQFRREDWNMLGNHCKQLATNVKTVSWENCYFMKTGGNYCWNVNREVVRVLKQVERFCNIAANL